MAIDKPADLSAFMAENAIKIEAVEYAVSERFKDKNGDAIKWLIQPITKEENTRIANQCKKRRIVAGTRDTKVELNEDEYATELVVACVSYPNLNDASLQESYGVVGAGKLIETMLTAGEFADLFQAVLAANDFETNINDKIKTVKN